MMKILESNKVKESDIIPLDIITDIYFLFIDTVLDITNNNPILQLIFCISSASACKPKMLETINKVGSFL